MSKLKKILLLQGGYNEEHEVSINTAKQIAKSLIKLKIDFKTITVNPYTFEKDILNKQWIILLEDGSDRSLKGFTTIAYIDVFMDNIDVRIVYSGDTIIHKNYWNTFELSKCWINTVLAHNQNIQKPLYWLLLSLMSRILLHSYLSLS